MSPNIIPAWVDGKLLPVDKLQAHRDGLRHKAISVFVLCGSQVLIQQRAQSKYHTPGLWANTCCTHPLWGEDALACANRRLAEELGIRDLSPQWRKQVEYRADVGGGLIEHEVVEVFVAHASRSIRFEPNPMEVMATRWIELADLTRQVKQAPDDYTPWLRIYLDQHLDMVLEPKRTA